MIKLKHNEKLTFQQAVKRSKQPFINPKQRIFTPVGTGCVDKQDQQILESLSRSEALRDKLLQLFNIPYEETSRMCEADLEIMVGRYK